MFSKEELLINTVQEQNIDILGVSEVDLEDFDEKKPFSIKGYDTFFHLERPCAKTKRLLCFTKENIEVVQRSNLMCNLLSNIWLEITTKIQKFLICVIYRKFSDLSSKGQMTINQQLERFKIFQSQVEKASKEGLILVLGGLNINLDKWEDSN